jgi:hypothetical protein
LSFGLARFDGGRALGAARGARSRPSRCVALGTLAAWARVELPNAPQFATVMYSWKGAGIANAMFQNDKLITKAQIGLQ